ncbi:MAG TPA: VWA domain-containing protein [Aliidongia sp.]|nr:VWA domain-containing protein [Aliidongia sp.]
MDGTQPERGRLLANLMYFARTLRAAGLPVGPGKLLDAVEAVRAVGIENRRDFYWALNAVFVNRRDQRDLFDQAFHIFWRNPRILEKLLAMVLPQTRMDTGEEKVEVIRRLAEAMEEQFDTPPAPAEEEIEFDAASTFSAREILQKTDFEQMSTDELALARREIAKLRLPRLSVRTRRFAPATAGARVDMRATLRAGLRSGGDTIWLKRRRPRTRQPPLVILCDISGSMSRYSRVFLHFMHAVTNDRDRVHTFLFGTRLTNITRYLRHKDVDVALDRVTEAVEDWSGGTRIGDCLADFNRLWSRRVLGQGALVLFISDGLDRAGGEGLGAVMERLHKSCRRLIWLNPLLRWDGFEPKSLGMKAILPHVDEFRPVHNLDSLADLTQALARPGGRRLEAAAQWRAS